MNLLDKFVDPELIRQLPFTQKVTGSLYVTLLGMAITFVALGIVWGFVVLLSRVFRAKAAPKKAVRPFMVPVQPELKSEEDEELVAVITAAIASSLQVPVSAIKVKNILRKIDHTPSWGRVGRIEQLRSTL